MKKTYLREIRHIIANYSLRNKATGYRIESGSYILKIIHDMIKRNWLKCENIDDPFLFVSPSKLLISAFGKVETMDKKNAVPSLKKNLIWDNNSQNSYCTTIEIAAV